MDKFNTISIATYDKAEASRFAKSGEKRVNGTLRGGFYLGNLFYTCFAANIGPVVVYPGEGEY